MRYVSRRIKNESENAEEEEKMNALKESALGVAVSIYLNHINSL